MLELDAGSLSGGEELSSIEVWDSLAVMGFIAMVDENVGMVISPAKLAQAKTVNDLAALLGDKIVG